MNENVPLNSLVKRVKVGYVGTVDKYYCDANDGVKIYRPTDITEFGFDDSNVRYITKDFYNKNKKSQLHYGDVVISRCGKDGIPIIYRSNDPAQILNAVIIEPDEEKMSAEEIQIFLRSPFAQAQISNNTSGSVQGVINTEMIASLQVDTGIDYSEVAKFVGIIEQKISNNNAIRSSLEGMAKLLYDYWFLQFEFPNEEGKPYKSSGGKMVYNEELNREIPEGWKFDSLRNRYSIKRGISYTSKDIESGKGTPMLNLACIDIDRNYRDGEIKHINNDIKEEAILNPGEMLIATTDLTRNADIVGCPIIVPYDGEKYTYSMDLAKMVITDNTLNKWYVYSALRTNHYHNYIKKWASGTNVLHLNLDGINWYKTILPDKVIQDRYAEIIEPICKKQGSILRENRELASLRDWLLPILMNGQVTFE